MEVSGEERKYREYKRVSINLLVIAAFLTLSAVMMMKLYKVFSYYPTLDSFKDRVISMGTVYGYDVSKKINIFYIFILGMGIGITVLYIILNKLNEQFVEENQNKLYDLAFELSSFGIAACIISLFYESIDSAIYYLHLFTVFTLIILVINRCTHTKIDHMVVEWSYLLNCSLMIFIRTIFPDSNIILCTVMVEILLMCIYILLKKNNGFNVKKMINSSFIIFFTPLVQSVIIELINILNRRGIAAFDNTKEIYIGLISISIIVACITYISSTQNNMSNIEENIDVDKYWYITFILMVGLILAQPSRMIVPWSEYFETANHGLALDRLFRYGELPIVESFDAHMLLNQVTGIIYYILNGYEPWAFLLYSEYLWVGVALITYQCFSKVMGKRRALLLVTTFPAIRIIAPQYIFSAMPLVYIISNMENRKSKYFNLKYWMLIAFTCFLSLDLGVIAILGSALAYISLEIINNDISIRRFVIWIKTGIIVAACIVLMFILICMSKDIDPIARIIEFLKLAMSNQNWTYNSVGNTSSIAFAIGYYIIPIIMVISCIYICSIIYKYESKVEITSLINVKALIASVFFGVAYFVNFSRGIVRHSLVEGTLVQVTCYFTLFILSTLNISNKGEKNRSIVIGISCVILVLISKINLVTLEQQQSMGMKASISVANLEEYETPKDLSDTRVAGEIQNKASIMQFKKILDIILNENETYLDMTSNSYYYALVNRSMPVYINQSPLILSGEVTQQLFIEQIEANNVPIAIIPTDQERNYIDGVNIFDKYYLITNYIYRNYEPLLRTNEFDIWCRKDKKDNYKENILLEVEQKNIFDFEYDDSEMIVNECIVEKVGNGVKLISQGEDSYCYNILNNHMGDIDYTMPATIEISFEPEQSGEVQVFYRFAEDSQFIEEKSYRFDINNIQQHKITINLEHTPADIRIDFDRTDDLIIKDIEVKVSNIQLEWLEKRQVYNSEGYRNLGLVPWYWANKDTEKDILHKEIIKYSQEDNILTLHDSNAKYLLVEIDLQEEKDINVNFYSSEENAIASNIVIRAREGKSLYRIRVDNIYSYVMGICNEVKIDEGIAIVSAYLES